MVVAWIGGGVQLIHNIQDILGGCSLDRGWGTMNTQYTRDTGSFI